MVAQCAADCGLVRLAWAGCVIPYGKEVKADSRGKPTRVDCFGRKKHLGSPHAALLCPWPQFHVHRAQCCFYLIPFGLVLLLWYFR